MKASRGFWISVAVILVAIAVYYPYSPVGTQRRNAKLAEQQILKLGPMLAADPRFLDVDLSTRDLGHLQVYCEVASEEDKADLIEIVKRSQPPVPVIFRVNVASSTGAATRSSQSP